MEIERKFAVQGFPKMAEQSRRMQKQGYLCTRPTVRIRETQADGRTFYELCFKGEGRLAREEVELAISHEVYASLAAMLPMPPVQKEQRRYALEGGLVLEVNFVDDLFYYAEVEFDSINAALQFAPPAFLGAELTELDGCSMSDYWEKKLLKNNK